MSHKSLKIEIAGLCAEVLVEDSKLFYCLESSYKNFLSLNKPTIVILVEKFSMPVACEKEVFTKCSFSPNRVTIAEKDGTYLILIKNGKSIRVSGLINPAKKQCRLCISNTNFSEALFIDSVRGCLHIFLERLKGVLLHASGAVYKGGGYIFTGPGGCGKSTAVNQLKDTTILSDECIGVKKYRNSYYMFGTPFHGNNNQSAVLKGIFFPKKAKKTIFKKITSQLAVQEILANAYHSILNGKMTRERLDTITELAYKVPCYEMLFSLNSDIGESIKNLH